MIKAFIREKELLDYYHKLNKKERSVFLKKLYNATIYANAWYLNKKSEIIKTLYDFNEKIVILKIEEIARGSLKITWPSANQLVASNNCSNKELISLYNNYIEIIYKITFYFFKIYNVAKLYEKLTYGDGDYPDVDPIIVGVCNKKKYGYDKMKLTAKFSSIILDIDSNFEKEWNDLKKYEVYKLRK